MLHLAVSNSGIQLVLIDDRRMVLGMLLPYPRYPVPEGFVVRIGRDNLGQSVATGRRRHAQVIGAAAKHDLRLPKPPLLRKLFFITNTEKLTTTHQSALSCSPWRYRGWNRYRIYLNYSAFCAFRCFQYFRFVIGCCWFYCN